MEYPCGRMSTLKIAAVSIYVSRGYPSGFLPLQDQQMYLTQASFKLLPLHWNSEHVRFCVCPLKVESLCPTDFWISHMQALLAFKARRSGVLSCWCRTPGLGTLMWGSYP